MYISNIYNDKYLFSVLNEIRNIEEINRKQ